jgi:serine phosphatase RsbU (regulator of sigma subunit)
MKTVVIKLILFSFFYFMVFNNGVKAEIVADSSWRQWQNTELPDSTRLLGLSQYILRGYLPKDQDSTLILARLLLDTAVLKKNLYFQGVAIDLMGQAHTNKGEIQKAVVYFMNALRLFEKGNSDLGVAIASLHLGDLYTRYKEPEKARFYFHKSLEGFKKMNSEKKQAAVINAMGLLFLEQKELDSAEYYFIRSLEIKQRLKDKRGTANSLNNIGLVLNEKGQFEQARNYHQQAYDLMKELEDKSSMATFYLNIGITYSGQKNYNKGVQYAEQAYELSKETGVLETQAQAAEAAYLNYKNLGRYKEAFEMLQAYKWIQDSLEKKSNLNELLNQKYKYDYEMKSIADSITVAKDLIIRDSEIKIGRVRQIILLLILIVIAFAAVVVYQKYGVVQKQRDTIQSQKSELERKNKAVTDSIIYAKKIQEALLPSQDKISGMFPEHFIFYKPKDIVAGDFYWFEAQDDKLLLAVADCTGHGVPGALISVICIAGLRRSVKELGQSNPALILHHTREFILSEFHKSQESVNDGMDISLGTYHPKTRNLTWSGAYNPLYVWRQGELLVYRGDRFPVGPAPLLQPFTSHSIELEPGDMIYLFTDGYADQFNEISGKKFTTQRLQQLLKSVGAFPAEVQSQQIQEAFEQWKGQKGQIDDVCLLGIRIV